MGQRFAWATPHYVRWGMTWFELVAYGSIFTKEEAEFFYEDEKPSIQSQVSQLSMMRREIKL